MGHDPGDWKVRNKCFCAIHFNGQVTLPSVVGHTSMHDKHYTAWKVSKYGVFSGPYFLVFGPNTGKCGPEKTPYLDAVISLTFSHSFLPVFSNFHCVWVDTFKHYTLSIKIEFSDKIWLQYVISLLPECYGLSPRVLNLIDNNCMV